VDAARRSLNLSTRLPIHFPAAGQFVSTTSTVAACAE
jgi:hypothetical protein